jgi:2-oxoglutarate dehydrogenase E1 component
VRQELIPDAFRRWGYLQANLDPLGRLEPQPHPDLELSGEAADRGRAVYCGPIGVEFLHMPWPDRCRWVQDRMESEPPPPDRGRILERLIRADMFERVLQTRYLGTKRYSLEGATALIPLLDEVLESAAAHAAQQIMLAMSHRGRLNVMAHAVGKNPADIFGRFEDFDPRSVLGGGDVKYHIGATGEYASRSGRRMRVSLVSNASHLESVNPVLLGRARAKQARLGDNGRAAVLAINIHGDAAFAGQGIAAETLNLAGLEGFSVGGTVHIVVNNLIGFTTGPADLHSSRYATDVAKRLSIPIFHVNGEDPEAVVRVARMAADYRYAFWSDVVIDLICYRLHGHSEVEDPTTTQPLLYEKIQKLPPLWQSYARAIGVEDAVAQALAERIRRELEQAQEQAKTMTRAPSLRELPEYWSGFLGGAYDPAFEVDTAVDARRLAEITGRITAVPESFHIHPKVQRLLDQRREMGAGRRLVDWGMAEALAFGSLLWDGIRVRLSGEDSRRGTFNQRYAVLVDVQTEQRYAPLAHLHPGQGVFECYDSPLSEAAVLGYEFGFSRDYPEALVLWEAQFGDFANGAQVIIDQFVSAAEDKWGLLSGLVMLLPHGYEGQGPEHSSARPERFLQLAGEDNLQITQPSTSAQYFHLLRRQAMRRWRKPLIMFTPKSLLRDPRACSPIGAFTQGRFLPLIPDSEITDPERVLICSGKIGHELRSERQRRGDRSTAILLLEQLYPFPEQELARELERCAGAREIVWVQEEPANMGALFFVVPRLRRLAGPRPVLTVKRSASASPATGSAKAHAIEQAALLALAFSRTGARRPARNMEPAAKGT